MPNLPPTLSASTSVPPFSTFDKQIFLEGGKEFEELIERLRTGKRHLEHLRAFLSARASLDDDSVAKRAKLIKPPFPDSLSPIQALEQSEVAKMSAVVGALKKDLLPKVDTLIKEQKKVKDAQKAAIAGTTKKLASLGTALSKAAAELRLKEGELAGHSSRIAMSSKEEERLRKGQEKLEMQVGKLQKEVEEKQGELQRVFGEWKEIADQARQLIARHEEDRERTLKDLVSDYVRLTSNGPSSSCNANESAVKPNKVVSKRSSLYSLDELQAITNNLPPKYSSESGGCDRVRALYPYNAQSGEELSFGAGDIIEVVDRDDDPWWRGQTAGRSGLFPSNFVTKL